MRAATRLTRGGAVRPRRGPAGRPCHLVRSQPDASRPGEFVAVLGPNGVGKSTLVKAALGLVPLAAGSVTVLGRAAGQAGHDDRLPAAAAELRRRPAGPRASTSCGSAATATAGASRCPGRSRFAPVQRRRGSASTEVIDLVGGDRLRGPPDRPGIRRRAAAPADRPGPGAAAAAAAARRAAGQPRPAEPERGRRAGLADLPGRAGDRGDGRPRREPDPAVPGPGGVHRAGGGAVCGTPRRGDHIGDADARCTGRRSRCCRPPTAGWSWSASPRRPPTTPTGTSTEPPMPAPRRAIAALVGRTGTPPDLEHGRRRPAAARVPVHGQRVPGRHDRRRAGRRRRLVHGAAPPELRRAHAGRRRRSPAQPAPS